jgi:hypothetical protein
LHNIQTNKQQNKLINNKLGMDNIILTISLIKIIINWWLIIIIKHHQNNIRIAYIIFESSAIICRIST